MTRLLALIFTLTLSITSKGQLVIKQVDKAIDSLKNIQVDTFLIYSQFCVGCVYNDTCNIESSKYLFWCQKEQTHLKKFSYCKTYQTISIETNEPLSFYLLNQPIIDTEEIKPPTYYEIKKQKGKSDTVVLSQYADHSTFYDFHFIFKDKERKITIDAFNLETHVTSSGNKNIYFESNVLSKTNALIDSAQNAIRQINEQKIAKDE